ncbi:nicotinamide riboside kinase [Schizosaccharomyces octosporus yFS286]|uniref:Nicotinamide riboside kinase n=1 Tax=Schizosaccharomyces octosporus (strain yFS286) TaxID=483514 RepID=S9R1K8_SCHOY|nr:nicotinamide riboside kinase [Schizosaccharomyces octosporus yFS286]EPX72300.1 nicotinamide riboside kinase [Schizosaccharomyces octosporus yFS286]
MPPKTVIVGVSGASCSGKSTLTQFLHAIFKGSSILHEDDFYKTDADIPVKDGVPDWDCKESLNLDSFLETLKYIRKHGDLPTHLHNRDNLNVAKEALTQYNEILKEYPESPISSSDYKFIFVDGFMLYVNQELIQSFDLCLMLACDFDTLKARRESRKGYVTQEGFWQDPPNYFENNVWPGYVNGHSHLFENKDVYGKLIDSSIQLSPVSNMSVQQNVQWAINTIQKFVS